MSSDAAQAATVNNIWRIAQLVIYAKLVDAQIDTMEKAEQRLRDIADFELQKAGFLFDRYTQKIVPCEDRMISLSCDAAPYAAKYDMAINRTQASIQAAYAEVQQELKDCASIWCYGATCATDRKFAFAKAAALTEAENVAIRIEDAKEEVDKEKLWARMATMVNVGRGFAADASASSRTAMAAYGQIANNAASSLSGNLAGLGDAASRLLDPYNTPKNMQGTVRGNGSQMTVTPESDTVKNSQDFENNFSQYQDNSITNNRSSISQNEIDRGNNPSADTKEFFNFAATNTVQ